MKSQMRVMGLVALFGISGCSGQPPLEIGVRQGRLAPCPDSPNCVSSMESGSEHYIAPLKYKQDRAQAGSILKESVIEQGNAQVQKESDEYLYVDFSSKVFGFVDDVEFYLPESEHLIHIRSASRLGYWDAGVNRKRVERIREVFRQKSAQ